MGGILGKRNMFINKALSNVIVTPILFSRYDAADLLAGAYPGAYLLYKDFDNDNLYLSVQTREQVEHYRIVEVDRLYYLESQPYPYLDSIILYHRKHKLYGTKLTQQVYINSRAVKDFTAKLTEMTDKVRQMKNRPADLSHLEEENANELTEINFNIDHESDDLRYGTGNMFLF